MAGLGPVSVSYLSKKVLILYLSMLQKLAPVADFYNILM